MSFGQIISANFLSSMIGFLFLLWMARMLLGRIPRWSGSYRAKSLMLVLLLELVMAILGAVCFRTGVWHWLYGAGTLLWTYFVVASEILLLWILYRAPLRECTLAALMNEMLYSYGEILASLYVYGKVYNVSIASERQTYLFWFLIINPACLLLCGLVIHKSGVGKVYSQWLRQEEMHKGIQALLICYPAFHFLLEEAINNEIPGRMAMLLPVALLLVIHMIFVYVGRDWQQKQYIAAQQLSIRQQTVYIEKMEQIQSELRGFRHDFKNMMTGMYLQAKEGDLEAVQSFIQEMTEDFDRQVGDQVRLMNQLANIHMVEVKGLLLEKLARMQKEEIRCELEVLRPFEGTRMRSTDLLRCLGILIDNAADEVRGKKDARIHLMISSQNGCTTFRVKNTLYGTVDFQRLGTGGYTTKGEGRGVGLESYQKILGKYDFVFPFTAIQDGYFVQELKIKET